MSTNLLTKIKGVFDRLIAYAIKRKEIIIYLIVGAMTTVISLASYAVFAKLFGIVIKEKLVRVVVSKVLSWIVAVTFAFIANKLWVFESKSFKTAVVLKEAGTFFVSRIATGCLEWFGLPLLIVAGVDQKIFGIEGMVANLIVSVLVIVLNYVFSKLFVFKKKEN